MRDVGDLRYLVLLLLVIDYILAMGGAVVVPPVSFLRRPGLVNLRPPGS
jgi:hypothetical protein